MCRCGARWVQGGRGVEGIMFLLTVMPAGPSRYFRHFAAHALRGDVDLGASDYRVPAADDAETGLLQTLGKVLAFPFSVAPCTDRKVRCNTSPRRGVAGDHGA